jgi:hypothetical protein
MMKIKKNWKHYAYMGAYKLKLKKREKEKSNKSASSL